MCVLEKMGSGQVRDWEAMSSTVFRWFRKTLCVWADLGSGQLLLWEASVPSPR